ncbi:Hypothetical protein SCF082_LOCUS39247 [Durusdinium trenchii]
MLRIYVSRPRVRPLHCKSRTVMAAEQKVRVPEQRHRQELILDIAIFIANQMIFRSLDCTNASTCAIPAVVTAARVFFVACNTLLLVAFSGQLKTARSLPQNPAVLQDIEAMQKRRKKAVLKFVILLMIHVTFGLVAPLVTSCCISIVALPYWWDKENSYWRKYGGGRNSP